MQNSPKRHMEKITVQQDSVFLGISYGETSPPALAALKVTHAEESAPVEVKSITPTPVLWEPRSHLSDFCPECRW